MTKRQIINISLYVYKVLKLGFLPKFTFWGDCWPSTLVISTAVSCENIFGSELLVEEIDTFVVFFNGDTHGDMLQK